MTRALTLVMLTACAGNDKEPGPMDDTDDTTPGDDTAGADDTDPEDPIALTGTLRDPDGNPITSGIRVQYCRGDNCMTPDDFEDGVYTFRGVSSGPGSFETVTIGGSIRYANAFAPIDVDEATPRTLDVTIPVLGAEVDLPDAPAELEPAPGLLITLTDGDLDRPTAFEDVPTAIAAVDATAHALPVEGVQGEVLAMYYMWPFNAPASGATLPVKIRDRWTLGSGEAELWEGDYHNSTWVKVGDLQDDADLLTPTGGAGLSRLTTVLVVRKP